MKKKEEEQIFINQQQARELNNRLMAVENKMSNAHEQFWDLKENQQNFEQRKIKQNNKIKRGMFRLWKKGRKNEKTIQKMQITLLELQEERAEDKKIIERLQLQLMALQVQYDNDIDNLTELDLQTRGLKKCIETIDDALNRDIKTKQEAVKIISAWKENNSI